MNDRMAVWANLLKRNEKGTLLVNDGLCAYVYHDAGYDEATLDGDFTAAELRMIADAMEKS